MLKNVDYQVQKKVTFYSKEKNTDIVNKREKINS